MFAARRLAPHAALAARRIASPPVSVRCLTQAASEESEAARRLRVLAASLSHVPKVGWTAEALALGAVDAGLPAVSHGIFHRGPIELVEYFMVR